MVDTAAFVELIPRYQDNAMTLHSTSAVVGSASKAARFALAVIFSMAPSLGVGEILWSGNFDDGTLARHAIDPTKITIFGTAAYGRAQQYGGQVAAHVGNGDLMWLTGDATKGNFKAGPRRGENSHALALFVKSAKGGGIESTSDPSDCDGGSSKNCTRRRTELRSWTKHWGERMAPAYSTRWASVSIYVPPDYDTRSPVGGFSPLAWQWKLQANNSKTSPPFAIHIENGEWKIKHRSHPDENPTYSPDWEWTFSFTSTYPAAGSHSSWPDGLKFFPNVTASRAALANLNKGGWTDFVMQVKLDGRSVAEGGSGFLKLWMRADDGPWVEVLHLFASKTERGSYTGTNALKHGIMYKGTGDQAYYGFVPTMYMGRDQVWNLPANGRLLYFDNMKMGSASATFAQMSPDATSPGSQKGSGTPPKPPVIEID